MFLKINNNVLSFVTYMDIEFIKIDLKFTQLCFYIDDRKYNKNLDSNV